METALQKELPGRASYLLIGKWVKADLSARLIDIRIIRVFQFPIRMLRRYLRINLSKWRGGAFHLQFISLWSLRWTAMSTGSL